MNVPEADILDGFGLTDREVVGARDGMGGGIFELDPSV